MNALSIASGLVLTPFSCSATVSTSLSALGPSK